MSIQDNKFGNSANSLQTLATDLDSILQKSDEEITSDSSSIDSIQNAIDRIGAAFEGQMNDESRRDLYEKFVKLGKKLDHAVQHFLPVSFATTLSSTQQQAAEVLTKINAQLSFNDIELLCKRLPASPKKGKTIDREQLPLLAEAVEDLENGINGHLYNEYQLSVLPQYLNTLESHLKQFPEAHQLQAKVQKLKNKLLKEKEAKDKIEIKRLLTSLHRIEKRVNEREQPSSTELHAWQYDIDKIAEFVNTGKFSAEEITLLRTQLTSLENRVNYLMENEMILSPHDQTSARKVLQAIDNALTDIEDYQKFSVTR